MRGFKGVDELCEDFKDERRPRGDVKPLPPVGLPKGYVGKYPPRLENPVPAPLVHKDRPRP